MSRAVVLACGLSAVGCDLVFVLDAPCTGIGERPAPMRDDFELGSTRTWGSFYETAGNAQTEGALELRLSGAPGCVGIKSPAFDACGMDFSIRVDALATGTSAYSYFSVTTPSGDIDFFFEDGSIRLPGGTIPFGPDHRYIRIRAGTPSVLLETAPDGVTWTTRSQIAAPEDLSTAVLDIGACCDSQESSPGWPRFDDLNITP